jgi:hypothetical protein
MGFHGGGGQLVMGIKIIRVDDRWRMGMTFKKTMDVM